MFILIAFTAHSQSTDSTEFNAPQDDLSLQDTTINIPKVDSSITDIINYDAVDSIYFDIASQQATLYGQAHLDYHCLLYTSPSPRDA